MTCNNCIHHMVCNKKPVIDRQYNGDAMRCGDFQNFDLTVEVPCKVGDTIYKIIRNKIVKRNVGYFYFDEIGLTIVDDIGLGYHIDELGKVIFFDKDEAEKRLEKLNEANK